MTDQLTEVDMLPEHLRDPKKVIERGRRINDLLNEINGYEFGAFKAAGMIVNLQDKVAELEARAMVIPDRPKDETGWLVESGSIVPRYRTMDASGIHWTDDPNKAIRFARRADAEMFAAGDEDAWRITEHMWCSP